MLRALFVSDLHIQNLGDERAQVFLSLLRQLRGAEDVSHLFLLGDIFDLWIGSHRHFQKTYAPIVREIERLVKAEVAVHYFEGNHDLYLKEFWQEGLGVRVHAGPENFQLGPWRVRLEHGDELDPEDRGYLFLRWLLRTPPLRGLAKRLPDALVVAIGEGASQKSRRYTSHVKVVSPEVARAKIRRHAENMAKLERFDILINGHVHVADDHRFSIAGRECRAINLGSWLTPPFRALELTDSGVQFLELERVGP